MIRKSDRTYDTLVHRKTSKLRTHWTSRVPKRYKRNNILGDLYRSKRISSSFYQEIEAIRSKYLKAGYPIGFINSVIKQFKQQVIEKDNINQDEESFIIQPFLFEKENNHLSWC